MIRSLGMILGACCVATLISQVIGLGILWYRGQLTSGTVRNIRAVLAGQDVDSLSAGEALPKDEVTSEDVVRERSERVLEFSTLRNELSVLKSMVDSNRTSLLAEKDTFLKLRDDFEKRLKLLETERTSAAAEQARGVLLAMPPAEAVDSLMRLSLDEDVMLLKEMPEKKIAALLQQFSVTQGKPPDEARVTRGQKIFEALTRGEPARGLIRDASGKLRSPAADREQATGVPAPAETPKGN
jgi:hypothetical protein